MNTKTKEIKVATLQGRFNKLHDAANYAEDCSKAIAFHADRLLEGECSEIQKQAVAAMDDAIDQWCVQFAELASDMQRSEALYMDHLSEDHLRCQLVEAVPAYGKGEIPNTFQMSEKLFKIGYYEVEEDFYGVKNHAFTSTEILTDLQDLHLYVVLCIKALANADYEGIWGNVGNRVYHLFDSFPNESFYKLLDAFGVKPEPTEDEG